MQMHREVSADRASADHQHGLAALAEHWDVPLSGAAHLVGATAHEVQQHAYLNSEQARFLDCLREIDLSLLVSHGTSRRWLRRRSRAAELRGKTPLEFLKPMDVGAAATVLRLASKGCSSLRR